ncbi:MBL fold metallo-hydrolase [Paraburkholderia madseniana]|uniref:MBL fold metallo-hydrolase n=1 Tax=Paraburkholderia madseniana TaxID=2599607 RepID=UPI001F28FD28|nr:MBL fold metallo-hydrolase [Paraburkholderia madseniana]
MKEHLREYLGIVERLGLRLVHAIDIHTHADHITALGDLRDATHCCTAMGERSKAECISRSVSEGETLHVDGFQLRAIYTPGHTDESFSFVLSPNAPEAVFTGDVLLIGGTGRTDF